MYQMLQTVCRKAWSGSPGTRFVMDLLRDGASTFPVFPVSYATLLGTLCTDRDSRECAWQALQGMGSFTAYLDEATQQALHFSSSSVLIADRECEALQRVVLQVTTCPAL